MELNAAQAYRSSRIIYFSLITGVVLFQLVTILTMDWELPPFKAEMDSLNIVSVVLLFSVFIGMQIAQSQFNNIKQEMPLSEKLMKFQTASIIRLATVEGVTLFSIVAFLLLEDSKQLIIFLAGIFIFATMNISKNKFKELAKLNEDEARDLFQ